MAISKRRRRDGTTVYQVRERDQHGRFYPTKTFKRKVDADRYRRYLLSLRDRGELAIDSRFADMIFKDYFHLWARECRDKISDGWKNDQDRMAKDYIFPCIGNKKLVMISSRDISTTLTKARETGLGDQTVLHIYNLFHKLFGDAVDHYDLPFKKSSF